MGRKSKFAVIAAVLVAAMAVAGAYLYDRSQEGKIANGVMIAGIAVGGMDAENAEGKLRRVLLRPLDRPLRAEFGDQSWKLSPAALKVRADIHGAVDVAVAASREGGEGALGLPRRSGLRIYDAAAQSRHDIPV